MRIMSSLREDSGLSVRSRFEELVVVLRKRIKNDVTGSVADLAILLIMPVLILGGTFEERFEKAVEEARRLSDKELEDRLVKMEKLDLSGHLSRVDIVRAVEGKESLPTRT